MHNEQIFRKKPEVVVLTQRNLTNKQTNTVGLCINFLIFIFLYIFFKQNASVVCGN